MSCPTAACPPATPATQTQLMEVMLHVLLVSQRGVACETDVWIDALRAQCAHDITTSSWVLLVCPYYAHAVN